MQNCRQTPKLCIQVQHKHRSHSLSNYFITLRDDRHDDEEEEDDGENESMFTEKNTNKW